MDDLISRTEAKEAIKEHFKKNPTTAIRAMSIIDDLPTHPTPSNTLGALDCVEKAEAIKAVKFYETFCDPYPRVIEALEELPSVHLELSNNSPKLDKEIGECNDCIKYGGDWECDRVHCHKGDVPDINVGDMISRQAAIDVVIKRDANCGIDSAEVLKLLPSIEPRKGKWINGMCSECKESTQGFLTKFCPNCGSYNGGDSDDNH